MQTLALFFIFSQSSTTIEQSCEEDWPVDYRMQAHCIETQREGQRRLFEFIDEYKVDLDSPETDISKMDPAKVIVLHCFDQWDVDFRMVAHCIDTQAEAARSLGKLGPAPDSRATSYPTAPEPEFPESQISTPPAADIAVSAERLLFEHGYMSEEPDGEIRGNTVAAVIDYQMEHGLKATGHIDQELIRHMKQTLSER